MRRSAAMVLAALLGACRGPMVEHPPQAHLVTHELPPLAPRAFGFSLAISEREHSDDAHGARFEAVLNDRSLHYKGPLGEGERGQYAHGTRTAELPDDAVAELRALLDRVPTVEESRPLPGDYLALTEVNAQITVVVEGTTRRIALAGPVDVYPTRDDALLAHASAAKDLARLGWALKRLVEPAE